MIRNLLKNLLRICATKILKKYHPEVIGITGSVGKSSTKEAIFAVLSPHFKVKKSAGNYNTEIGVPLTIIGAVSGNKSIFRWFSVVLRALRLILFRDKKYPEILILEMAADQPGDIRYLTEFTKPAISVITTIGASHLHAFNSIDRTAREKSELVRVLPKDGFAVLNFDDERVSAMQAVTHAKILTFGFSAGADVRGLEVALDQKLKEWKDYEFEVGGTMCKIQYQGSIVPLYLPNVLGRTHVYAALAAATVGIAKQLNLVKIVEALNCYLPPPGRLRILPGIKYTYLIDDTYNAAPASMKAALEVLSSLQLGESARRYAVLGDMLELGELTEIAHEEIGEVVADSKVDELIVVGERAAGYLVGAKRIGMSEDHLHHLPDVQTAGRFLQDKLKSGDVVLIKASRAMHFEKIVKELLADPIQAEQLLVH